MKNKISIGEDISNALFLLFDLDDSGEIDPTEMSLFDRKIFAVSKEEKAKKDAIVEMKK